MPGELILVVDDEPNIRQLARLYLEREGYRVESVEDGATALRAIETRRPALVILDVMLPGVDGFEVCRRLRAADNFIPILMLTARDDAIDKILGLELGADDYLTKPFNPRELTARVRAILRRGEWLLDPGGIVQVGALRIDPQARLAFVNSQPLDLRTKEFDLLLALAQNAGRLVSREKLLQLAWGYDFYGQTRTVDVHVSHLRRKLGEGSVKIETVSGIGYKLMA